MNSPDINSYYVYSRISPHRLHQLTFMFIVLTGACFCVSWLIDMKSIWELYIGVALLLTWSGAQLFIRIKKRMSYPAYQTFKENLGYPLKGWETFLADPKILKAQHWVKECSVQVVVTENADEQSKKYINDALFLFTKTANERFYRGPLGGDGRHRWKVGKGTTAAGSADVAVTGDLYALLNDYLKSIQQKTNCIREVNVLYKGEPQYVKFRNGAY